ncbi:hypothetical protein [Pollutibacter soli]|uniref:hypothetical protein n=1 Tax=Pollutibacter soli TaxID=3034157 RepID=UPI0030132238
MDKQVESVEITGVICIMVLLIVISAMHQAFINENESLEKYFLTLVVVLIPICEAR